MIGGSSDPNKLEGRAEDARPREFFWDSVTKYVVGIILGLAALDTITEYIRGSSISCRLPDGSAASDDFINNYCSANVPRSEYFPAFIAVHAILILIPHSLWVNRYESYFVFFFTQCKQLDRTRNSDTGVYSENNYLIVDQLDQAFTTYNQNGMFLSYIAKVLLQLILTLVAFFVAVFYFTDFSVVFLCPSSFSNATTVRSSAARYWPLTEQVTCVYNSMRLFSVLRFADLFLLVILILGYIWSLLSCTASHSSILGTDQIAKFSFQSSISPRFYVFGSSALHNVSSPVRAFLQAVINSIPYLGSGQYIRTDLDFLMLKLFRTDSGLGVVLREMQILSKIKDLNDDDQRIVNLHRTQQRVKDMKSGDILGANTNSDSDSDISWIFVKEAGQPGLFHAAHSPLGENDVLVLPSSIRGSMLGFASLAPSRSRAMFVTFGSTALGIPSALARVFTRVYVLNFNPYFKKKEMDKHYIITKYSSEIHAVNFPEDILSSEYKKSSDFGSALVGMKDKVDFVVVGPVEKKHYLSTLHLCFHKMTNLKIKDDAVMLTVTPTRIGTKETIKQTQFYPYVPSKIYFTERKQCVRRLRKHAVQPWPPVSISEDKSGSVILNQTAFKVLVGNTNCQLRFNVYERPKKEIQYEDLVDINPASSPSNLVLDDSLSPSRSSNEPSRNESKQKANPDIQLAIQT